MWWATVHWTLTHFHRLTKHQGLVANKKGQQTETHRWHCWPQSRCLESSALFTEYMVSHSPCFVPEFAKKIKKNPKNNPKTNCRFISLTFFMDLKIKPAGSKADNLAARRRTGRSCSLYTWSPHTERGGWGWGWKEDWRLKWINSKIFVFLFTHLDDLLGIGIVAHPLPQIFLFKKFVAAQLPKVIMLALRWPDNCSVLICIAKVANMGSCRNIFVLLETMPTV